MIERLDGTRITADALSARVQALMSRANVHGLALSVFNRGENVYNRAFGLKHAVTKEPLRTDTVFYGASLSKAVFAVLVMRLVEEGVIDLDTPNWRWFEPDRKLRVKFEPGTRYSYSGEGMTFLQVALERLTKKSLEELMNERMFRPYGMATSSYTWQPRFEKNYCHGHSETGQVYEKDKDNAARGPSTLETTAEDYARFTGAVLEGRGLKAGSWKEMFSPQIRIRSKRQFGPLSAETTPDNDDIALSYGLGWGLLETPHGRGVFKEGHGDGFEHYSIVFPGRGLGVVILTNSANGESIFKELLEVSIADVYTPWEWQDYVPYDRSP